MSDEGELMQFMRGGKTLEKRVPTCSEELVVIPSNLKGTGFLRKYYAPNKKYLGGLISKNEFDGVIDTCSVLTAKAFSFCKISEF